VDVVSKKENLNQWFYETMLKIRLFEEKIIDVYARGLMPGLAHLYIGEEAVATGACATLEPSDYITSTHRGHGHCIAKGGDLNKMMAELFGKKTGYCRGKGGSMHIADTSIGILGANGVVGGGIPIATGAALSSKLRKSNQVTICFFGDAASNQGSFHESINFASVHKLPVIYVVENNQFGISVHQSRHQNIQDIADRAVAYGIEGKVIDGNDVLAVKDAVGQAVAKARSGEGPSIIECKTYRWRGHHEGDPNQGARYRDPKEIDDWKKKCPIARFEKYLKSEHGYTDETFKATRAKIQQLIEDAVEFARSSPEPDLEVALQDVYYEGGRK
jgi:pyruvate dehydrogenase E1 component alpha subunit